MAKVLITGGSGFIGSNLAKRLVVKGNDVTVLDNLERGNLANLEGYEIKTIDCDVRDKSLLKESVTDEYDYIYHLAAINGTKNFYLNPYHVLEVNTKGVINMLEICTETGCEKFIFSSSSEVYNQPTKIPTKEDERILIPDIMNPRFSYSGSKIIGELFCIHYSKEHNLKTKIVRYHNIYGPRMGFDHVIPELIMKMKKITDNFSVKSADLKIQGSGDETRAFCYIDDAVEATIHVAEKGNKAEIYNVGNSREEISIKELVKKIAAILGLDIRIIPSERLAGSTNRRCPDIGKIMKLGYIPHTDLNSGLKRTIEFYSSLSVT